MADVTPVTHYCLYLSPAEAQALQNAITVVSAERVLTASDSEDTDAADAINEHLTDICQALHDAGIKRVEGVTFAIGAELQG